MLKLTTATVLLFLVSSTETLATHDSPQTEVQHLLDLAKGQQADAWATSLMAADAEAGKMATRIPGGCCGFRCVRIDGYTLTFRWSEIRGEETYQHDLLKAIVRARPKTKAGVQALIRLLRPGCGPLADEWIPYFRVVLDILESSPWREMDDPELTRIRAEAYETWWSLSKASPNDPALDQGGKTFRDFTFGAADARLKAIEAYQQVLEKDPRDQVAIVHLKELRAGNDTHQRKWYCFAD